MANLKPNEIAVDVGNGEIVYLPSPNFSYEFIPEGGAIKLHEYQQMIVDHLIEIDGLLCLDGTLAILD